MRVVAALVLAALAVPAEAATLVGPAEVIDGDTLEVEGRRIRLYGIDAPELSQSCDRNGESWACGEAAAEALRAMIGSYALTCEGSEIDDYGRLLAVCSLAGVELNRALVVEGWAIAFRRYSEAYVDEEVRARAGQRGVWAASFAAPEDYRMAQDVSSAQQEPPSRTMARRSARAAPTACLIKGNRSRRGEWIYHLPGMPYYEATRAEETFCTEAEAEAAGYRRSRAG